MLRKIYEKHCQEILPEMLPENLFLATLLATFFSLPEILPEMLPENLFLAIFLAIFYATIFPCVGKAGNRHWASNWGVGM